MTYAHPSAPRPGGTAPLADRRVARIGYGAMQLGHRPVPVDSGTAIAVLRRARELGVDHIDTAAFYGDGVANAHIRAALHPYDELTLVTKVGASFDSATGTLIAAQKPRELRAEVEKNLRQLDVNRLAVVNLRRMDMSPGLIAEADQIVDIDSQLSELAELRNEGKIGAIGLSHISTHQLRRALPFGIACVQNIYNLLDRRHEDELSLCQQHGIAWVPYFPLGSAAQRADHSGNRDHRAPGGERCRREHHSGRRHNQGARFPHQMSGRSDQCGGAAAANISPEQAYPEVAGVQVLTAEAALEPLHPPGDGVLDLEQVDLRKTGHAIS